MGYLQQEMIKEQVMNDEIARLERELNAANRRVEIAQGNTYALARFITVLNEYAEFDNSDISNAVNDMSEPDHMRVLLMTYSVFDRDVFYKEYEVTLNIPMYITITVEEMDEERAFEEAKEVIERDGVDSYWPDFDMYNAEMTDIREV